MLSVKYVPVVIVLLILTFVCYINAKFIVEDDEMVVITQFGKLVGEAHVVQGEFFKIPFIQKTHYFRNNILSSEEMKQIPTLNNKYISLKLRIKWKINDPSAFYENFNDPELAKDFIGDEVGETARQIVASHEYTDQIFQIHNSDIDDSVFCPNLESEIKKTAENEISKSGLHLVHVGAEIIK